MSTRNRSDDDFDREVRAHIEIETERLIDEGMAPDARARGSAPALRQRDRRPRTLLRGQAPAVGRSLSWQDLRCAARNMRRYPVSSLVAVLSLAAGIGATTVTLTVRDVIFRKPPPLYPAPRAALARSRSARRTSPIMPIGNAVPIALYDGWREADWPLDGGVRRRSAQQEIRTGDRTAAPPLRAITPELFDVLGVGASLGAAFSVARPRPPAVPRPSSSAIASGRNSSTSAPTRSAASSGSTTSRIPSSA